ncbi:MAG: hypothetical protein AAF997_17940 [Myxococcota bacterium]
MSATSAAALAVGLTASGAMPRSEAATAACLLAFLVYLAVALWAFAEPRLGRVWVAFSLVIAASLTIVAVITPALLDPGVRF